VKPSFGAIKNIWFEIALAVIAYVFGIFIVQRNTFKKYPGEICVVSWIICLVRLKKMKLDTWMKQNDKTIITNNKFQLVLRWPKFQRNAVVSACNNKKYWESGEKTEMVAFDRQNAFSSTGSMFKLWAEVRASHACRSLELKLFMIWYKSLLCCLRYAPINSKLQHPPPGHTPGIWLCIVPVEGGIWTLRWKGGDLNRIYLLFWRNMLVRFSVFAGFDGFTS